MRGIGHLGHEAVHVREQEVGRHLDDAAAIDDQVLVRVGDAHGAGLDVAEDGPDEGHAWAAGFEESDVQDGAGGARVGPAARRVERRAARSRPATAIAAAVPAAWPIAMHWAIDRTEAWASWVALKQRPATSTFAASRTSERAVRDPDRLALGQVGPGRARAGRVVLDRRPAQADRVVERPGRQDVVAGQAVVAVHAAGLADADLGPERDERGGLVAGHAVDEEPDVLERLPAPGDLGGRQEVRVRGVRHAAVAAVRGEPGHDRGRHAADRRDVVAALATGQVVRARGCRVGHQAVELGGGQRAATGDVHVRPS